MTIPGFVDLQVNGYKGTDFSSPTLTEEAFAQVSRDLLGQGTAAFLPTLITSPLEVYRRNLPLVARVMARSEFEGRLLGIHLEGPFISREPGAVGAHNPAWVLEPSTKLLDEFQELAGGRIRLLTVAAEAPGAEELVRHAVGMGLTVSLGHHMATEADLARMALAGARALTHLGNGVPTTLPRHSNPIWAGLACDNLSAMIITDGHHLPPAVLKVMIRAKGIARIVVTSDQTALAGMPPGRYGDVVLEESGRAHIPSRGCLAGSTATMPACMNHLASLGWLNPDELVAVGFHNPLRLIGLHAGAVRSEARLAYDAARRTFSF